MNQTNRRKLLGTGAGLGGWLLLRPATATPDELSAAIQAWTGGVPPQPGGVQLDIAPIVDNGNTVPVAVTVDSPMSPADHVTAIALFNQRNPQREIAFFTLGPRSGRARVATRIRLATSQKLVAVARLNDGSFHAQTVDVIVSIAACIEGES